MRLLDYLIAAIVIALMLIFTLPVLFIVMVLEKLDWIETERP